MFDFNILSLQISVSIEIFRQIYFRGYILSNLIHFNSFFLGQMMTAYNVSFKFFLRMTKRNSNGTTKNTRYTFILCTPRKNEYKKVNPFSIECRT